MALFGRMLNTCISSVLPRNMHYGGVSTQIRTYLKNYTDKGTAYKPPAGWMLKSA